MYVALDLGCHTTRAVALSRDRAARCRSCADRTGAGVTGTGVNGCRGHDGDGHAEPLRRGVVVDVAAAAGLVSRVLRDVRRFPLGPWRALVCAPSDASPGERAALVDAVEDAGARVVAVVPEPLAAGIGAGLDVGAPWAQMVVDVGHGVTDAAVIREGELIATRSLRVACADVQAAVAVAAGRVLGARVDRDAAEALTRRLGILRRGDAAARRAVLRTALPATHPARDDVAAADAARDVLAAADAVSARIVDAVAGFTRGLEPEVGCEVIESGIVLCGGGALLDWLAPALSRATAIPVRVAADPLAAVISGARAMLHTVRTAGLRAS